MDHHLQRLRIDASVIADAVRTGPLDAVVAACPGWDLAELGRHIGFIHRWARLAASCGAAPDSDLIDAPPPDHQLAAWIEAGADELIAVLSDLDPDQPTWHPFPVPKVASVWPRRQAKETMIHAWDAVHAIGGSPELDPAAAADGVGEYFEVIVPRVIVRTGRAAPTGVMAIRFTDSGDPLVVRNDDGTSVVLDPTAAPDTEVVGRADDLCLAFWNRRPLADPPEHPLAEAWLGFGGN